MGRVEPDGEGRGTEVGGGKEDRKGGKEDRKRSRRREEEGRKESKMDDE
jgi:hypothetical protein